MNDLAQWLADVKAFNADVGKVSAGVALFEGNRAKLEIRGQTIGLKRSKIKSMLASVKLKVEMPVEHDTPKA